MFNNKGLIGDIVNRKFGMVVYLKDRSNKLVGGDISCFFVVINER